MKPIKDNREYIKRLEEYWEISEANKPPTTTEVAITKEDLAESIKDFRNRRIVANALVKSAVAIGGSFVSSILLSVALIWGINEVMKFNVPYTLKNVVIISLLFFIGKMKVKFTIRNNQTEKWNLTK